MNSQQLAILAPTQYKTKGKDAVLSPDSNKQLLLWNVTASNGTGAIVDIGIGYNFNSYKLKSFLVGSATTDVTADLLAGTAVTIVGTTNNDGFIVQGIEKFNMLVMNISQAQTGSPIYAYQYWNGSSFQNLTLEETPDYTSTGYAYVVFTAPVDWVTGNGGTAGDSDKYTIRIRATTAPTQAVQADSIKVIRFFTYKRNVPADNFLQTDFQGRQMLLESQESIFAYFSTANDANIIEAAYQMNG